LTLRGYARHRKAKGLSGGSLAAVQKAVAAGRISVDVQGRIDRVEADRAWSENTLASKVRTKEQSTPKTPAKGRTRARGGTLVAEEDGEDYTLASERARKERADRKLRELTLRRELAEVVDVSKVAALNFRVGRQIRSRLEALPDRLAEVLAAEDDPQAVDEILRGEIRKTLELLGADPSGVDALELEDEGDDDATLEA
jgi:hypothetical protein